MYASPAGKDHHGIKKGDFVFLSYGRPATVQQVFPRMNVARVRTSEGSERTLKLSELHKPEMFSTIAQLRLRVPQVPVISEHAGPQAEKMIGVVPYPGTQEQASKVGRTDRPSGRQIVQPTSSPVQNERLAAQNASQLDEKLSRVSAKIPGASYERLRPQKNLGRVQQKVREGKPAQTISDYLAAQIAVDSPEAKGRMIRELRKEFEIVQVDDKFLKGRPDKGGYPSANLQVKFPNGGTAEVQIVPRDVQAITDTTHHLYKEGRNARDTGDRARARQAFSQARKLNSEALDRFKLRNQLTKGQTVTLVHGGKAVVQYVSPTMNVVRVRTVQGKTRTVRFNQIQKNS